MPKVAEIKMINGEVWVRLERIGEEGQVTIWSTEEIKKYKHDCVEAFLIDLFDEWERRQ